MIIGFTGTQNGMTPGQKARVAALLSEHYYANAENPYAPNAVFRHGDCIGADAEAAQIAKDLGYHIVSHPPDDRRKRALFPSDETMAPLPYLKRDRVIATSCDVLIAAPKTPDEQLRSGTWATVRYARKANCRIFVVPPDEPLP
jgi:hypothetical protein